ncbi:MAG: DUF1186 domain-containing protein [Verrucomicrobiae bacterium]|nr:DUF1186 domain-containing protein [Verrucomicrobiae bacterium]
MSDSEAAVPNSDDASAVNQLLRLGGPPEEGLDYAGLGISLEAVPELIRMATDPALNDGPADSPLVWAPVHAWRALGQLRAAGAVEPLLTLLRRTDAEQDDWVATDLPVALGQIGGAAVGPVANYLADTAQGEWARTVAAETLGKIGEAHPEWRAECVARLQAQLEKFGEQSEALNAFLILPLYDLLAVEAMPLIERAFASGRVDESVVGDVEDVQIHFGLKAEREHPLKPNSLTDLSRRIAAMEEEIEALKQENAELQFLQDELRSELPPQPYLAPPKTGRNEPCPCGSGKKYKKCCGA